MRTVGGRTIERSGNRMRNKTMKWAMWSAMTAISLALSVVETVLIPAGFFPVPGFRIGFSNIVTLISVYLFGALPTAGIVIMRTFMVFAFGGNVIAFLFSLFGGILAVAAMVALKRARCFSMFGVSAGGAAAHSTGQILAAAFLTGSKALFLYLPLLLWLSIPAGLLIALLSTPIVRALEGFSRSPRID